MSEQDLLQLVLDSFRNTRTDSHQIADIQTQIAEHLTCLAQDQTHAAVPSYVQGIRREYLRARTIEARAKQGLIDLQQENSSQDVESSESHSLASHLDVLRLQRLVQHSRTATDYTQKIDDMSGRLRLHEDHYQNIAAYGRCTNDTIQPLADHAHVLMRQLEIAVLHANYSAQREQRLVAIMNSNRTPQEEARNADLEALAAVRTNLTEWIEQSLARCDSHEAIGLPEQVSNIPDDASTDENIERQYSEYIRARQRLLSVIGSLQLQLDSEQHPSAPTSTAETENRRAVLPMLDAQMIQPALLEVTAGHQHHYIRDLAATSTQRLVEELRRLGDESHLLPAYPILAKRKQHQRSRSGLGQELMASSQISDMTSLIESWKFAIEAAQLAATSAVDKSFGEGQTALNNVNSIIQEMHKQMRTWSELDHS